MKNILKKIREQPESVRKVIFWVLAVFFGVSFFGLWLGAVGQRTAALNKDSLYRDLNISDLEKRLKNLPKIEIPKLNDRETKDLEKVLLGGSSTPTPSFDK